VNKKKQGFYQQAWTFSAVGLLLFLLSIQVLFIINQPWVADYWEHLAVVQELYRNLLNPAHPIIPAHLPHAFFSPYSVGITMIGRLLTISPEMIANAAGICNLLLFVYAVWVLTKLVVRHENKAKSFVILLLMILFFWGILPPYYSSFYHFISMPFVSSYPATFAFSLSVVSAFLFKQAFFESGGFWRTLMLALVCIVLNYIVLITHPLTFFFCFTIYLFVFFQRRTQQHTVRLSGKRNRLFFATGIAALALPICFLPLWPYYSFFDLLGNASSTNRFHLDSSILYQGLIRSYFPFILPVGFLMYDIAKKSRYAYTIGCIMALLLAIYVFGFLNESYGYGRVISFMAIWMQVWLTDKILNIDATRIKHMVAAATMILACPFFVFSLKVIVVTALTTHSDYLKEETDPHFAKISSQAVITHRLFFIKRYVKSGELVICNPVFSRYVPGLGGKAAFNPYADYWIPDNTDRLTEVQLFFGTGDSVMRKNILEKYRPSFLLFSSAEKQRMNDCRRYFVSDSIFSENELVLVKLNYE
jgi:hypothetical protein